MSQNDHPTQCPYCRTAPPPVWVSSLAEWRCESCQASFVIQRHPWREKEPGVKKDPRIDLIAQAYRGRISVRNVMRLTEGLLWRARRVVETNQPCTTVAPRGLDDFSPSPHPRLEITP